MRISLIGAGHWGSAEQDQLLAHVWNCEEVGGRWLRCNYEVGWGCLKRSHIEVQLVPSSGCSNFTNWALLN